MTYDFNFTPCPTPSRLHVAQLRNSAQRLLSALTHTEFSGRLRGNYFAKPSLSKQTNDLVFSKGHGKVALEFTTSQTEEAFHMRHAAVPSALVKFKFEVSCVFVDHGLVITSSCPLIAATKEEFQEGVSCLGWSPADKCWGGLAIAYRQCWGLKSNHSIEHHDILDLSEAEIRTTASEKPKIRGTSQLCVAFFGAIRCTDL